MATRVGRYETVLQDCRRLLGELGLTTSRGPGFGAQLEGTPGEILGTPPAPRGPLREIIPVPPPLPREPGFTPAPAGTGPLITLPAPDLGSGVQDGPGSGQRSDPPPVTIDANSAGTPGQPGQEPPAVKPVVQDTRLNNILDNLYKGVDNLGRTGDGTTADAVRYERVTGNPVGGRTHTIKAQESVQALSNWLARNLNAPVHERAVAETERLNLIQALNS